jgi:hypothetical protein
MDHAPQLPRLPDDPENIRRLREDAERRIARQEEELSTSPGYSTSGNLPENVPQPAYGGPPLRYRRNLAKLLMAGIAALSAACRFVKRRRDPAQEASQPAPPTPAYGGPPSVRPAPNRILKPPRD